jgi:hypothetical protein
VQGILENWSMDILRKRRRWKKTIKIGWCKGRHPSVESGREERTPENFVPNCDLYWYLSSIRQKWKKYLCKAYQKICKWKDKYNRGAMVFDVFDSTSQTPSKSPGRF